MSILTVLIVLVVVGVVLYLINAYVPMDDKIKKILNVVVVIFVIIWILKVVGAWSYLAGISV